MGVIRKRYVGCKPILGCFGRLFCSYIAELHIYATELLIKIPPGVWQFDFFQQDVGKQGVAC